MKYSLRSLMIVVLVAPPLLAGAYYCLTSNEPKAIGIAAIALFIIVVVLQAFLFPDHHRHL
jgi:hypothetical protein